MKLPAEYYLNSDVVELANDLIGKVLCTRINGKVTSGRITETEAYAGEIDKASHSYGGRRTERTSTMYMKGGVAYVYLCYGMHHLFNVVTNVKGIPHAVLIRAIEPVDGVDWMMQRRGVQSLNPKAFIGPGKVSSALGISKELNATSLFGKKIWIEDRGLEVDRKSIISGPRIGVDYAGEHAKWPYRFKIHNY